jgi:hypothetical protein
MSLRSLSWIALLATAACNNSDPGVTPRQACENTSSALCERLYACHTAAEIAASGLPADEAACVTTLDAQRGCAAQTVDNVCTGGNQKYNGVEAAKCGDQVVNLTCAEVRDPAFNVQVSAPACAAVCVAPM